jgi:serine/threonine-protein kinase RsbW
MDRTTATVLTAMDITGYADETIRKMKIVLTELLVNSIVHGNGRDHTKKVVVGHVVDRKQVTVSILDEGAGFDPTTIPDPTLPENLEKPYGRGLYIVQHYVESLTFNETGNRVTIRKINDNIT